MNQGSRRGPQLAGELAGDDPTRVVDQPLGQDDRRRQVVPRGGQRPRDRGDRRPVARPRPVRVEARWADPTGP